MKPREATVYIHGDAINAPVIYRRNNRNRRSSMNTLDITKLDDTRVRVTIRSTGERDQHVDLAIEDLLGLVAAGTNNPHNTTATGEPSATEGTKETGSDPEA